MNQRQYSPRLKINKYWYIIVPLFVCGIAYLSFQNITSLLIPILLILFLASFVLQKVVLTHSSIELSSFFSNPIDYLHSQKISTSDIKLIRIQRVHGRRSIGYTRVFIQDVHNKEISFPMWIYYESDIRKLFEMIKKQNNAIDFETVANNFILDESGNSLANYEAQEDYKRGVLILIIVFCLFIFIFILNYLQLGNQ